eukprot:4420-Heterococcus_DN1.PRE.5
MTNNISLDSTPSLSTVAAVAAAVMVVTAVAVVMQYGAHRQSAQSIQYVILKLATATDKQRLFCEVRGMLTVTVCAGLHSDDTCRPSIFSRLRSFVCGTSGIGQSDRSATAQKCKPYAQRHMQRTCMCGLIYILEAYCSLNTAQARTGVKFTGIQCVVQPYSHDGSAKSDITHIWIYSSTIAVSVGYIQYRFGASLSLRVVSHISTFFLDHHKWHSATANASTMTSKAVMNRPKKTLIRPTGITDLPTNQAQKGTSSVSTVANDMSPEKLQHIEHMLSVKYVVVYASLQQY